MKTILFIIALILFPLSARPQENPVDKIFEKYSGMDGFTSVYISRYMFSLFSGIENKDKDMEDIFGKLTGIRILASEKPQSPGVNFFAEIIKDLPAGEYQELMVIKEKGQDFKFLIRENDGKISELLMVAGGISNNALISIRGDIDLNTISKLSRSMKIDGLDALEKIE
jgi:hypothetical protein